MTITHCQTDKLRTVVFLRVKSSVESRNQVQVQLQRQRTQFYRMNTSFHPCGTLRLIE